MSASDYLQRLRSIERAFPPLKSFLGKIKNVDIPRKIVQDFYEVHDRSPGRCYGLQFEADKVSLLQGYPHGFESPQALSQYLEHHPAESSRISNKRRLFILEDMEPDYVSALGEHLGVFSANR
jgi:hypothetical protein